MMMKMMITKNSNNIINNNNNLKICLLLQELMTMVLQKYQTISEETLHKDHSLANNLFLQLQSIHEHQKTFYYSIHFSFRDKTQSNPQLGNIDENHNNDNNSNNDIDYNDIDTGLQ